MEEKYLDKTGLALFWSKLKELLAGKQNKLTGTLGQIVSFDIHGNPVAEDAEKSAVFNIILTKTDWIDCIQTINDLRFVSEGYSYIVSPTPQSLTAYADAGIYAEDVSTDGCITFYCKNIPDEELHVNIIRVVIA